MIFSRGEDLTSARHYFFAIVLAAIMLMLFSPLALAAPSDLCDCDTAGCQYWEFCDQLGTYSGSCMFNDPYDNQCITCRYESATCKPAYNDADCCGDPGLNCTFAGGATYRCCPDGYKWNSSGYCQAPPPANPCAGSGSGAVGNAYCSGLGTGKNLCCGTAGNGHCEECCALADCPGSCKYCNSTGTFGNWKCSNQINTDLRDDCGSMYQVCNGAGGCKWIPNTPPTDCTWPPQPVFDNGKIYELIMCTYNCQGQCPQPDPYVSQPNNWNFCKTGPVDNPFWGYQGGFGGCAKCLSDAMADCLDICVVTNGDGCDDYSSVGHPQGCCDPNDECSNNHCCPAGRAWNGTGCGGCGTLSTSGNYVCANSHTGGSASCACGGPCYTFSVSGVNYVQNCSPTQRCITYHPNPLVDPDAPASLRVCSTCKASADCCVEGMTATLDSTCKTCNANWWLNGTHCCQKGWRWNSVAGACEAHDSCYRAGSSLNRCTSRAPNCLPALGCTPGPEPTWWGTPFNTYCVIDNPSPSPDQACCFINAGLFGLVSGDTEYYWHERQDIVTY